MADEHNIDDDNDADNADHLLPPSPSDQELMIMVYWHKLYRLKRKMLAMQMMPTTYQQAMNSDDASDWVKAMSSELNADSNNDSWEIIPRKQDVRLIGCRWVFTKKRDCHGHVVRHKALLVSTAFKLK